jgi:hypothetical protein
MAAASSQPSIQAIAQSTGIGNGDIKRTAGLDDPADFPQATLQIVNVLKAVVRYQKIKLTGCEGQVRRICLNEIRDSRIRVTFQIQSHHKAGKPWRIKGAASASEIQYDASRQALQELDHAA